MKFPGDPADIAGVGLCTIRCCKAFLKADGTLLEPVMSWMDTRAYQPWVPDDPELAWATTSSGYLTHRLTGEFRDSAANNIILQWPIDTDTWRVGPGAVRPLQHAPGAARGAADAGRHRRLRHRGRGGGDRHPGGAAGRDHRQRQGRRGARLRLARRAHGAHLAGHVHRLHGPRPREPPGRRWTSGPTSPASRTATCTRAAACAAACGRSPGSSTCWGPRSPRPPPRRRFSREEYLEREAAARPGRELRPDDGAGLAGADRQALPQGRDPRLRRAPHAGARVPVHPRGDRADHEGERRRHVRRARHRPARDRRLRRRRQQPALHADLRGRVRRPRLAQRSAASGASLGSAICAAVAAGVYPDFARRPPR